MSHQEPYAEPPLPRIVELWCDRALFGLDLGEAAEMEQALTKTPDDGSFELAVAALTLCSSGPLEAMPADLARRVAEAAAQPFSSMAPPAADNAPTVVFPGRLAPLPDLPAPGPSSAPRSAPPAPPSGGAEVIPLPTRSRTFATIGWLAAAACLALAAGGWWKALRVDPIALKKSDWTVPTIDAPARSAAEERDTLLGSSSAVRAGWKTTEDPAAKGASGDVVWDNEKQRGYMRFNGLAKNDPAQTQYQLWIFDADKDERYPVDGGVFDVTAEGDDVIVAIDAKIGVDRPTLFAVTVEKPGGVVVSDRKRIVLTAAVPG